MSIRKFTLCYLVYSLVMAGTVLGLTAIFKDVQLIVNKFWLIFFFLGGLTYIAYIVAYLGIKMNPEIGIMTIMGSIVIKIIFSLAFVLVYSINTGDKSHIFILNFFSLYFLFSFFEIYSLLCNLRHQNK